MLPYVCQSCAAENESTAKVCHLCGCPFFKTPEPTGRKPYNVSLVDLIKGAVFAPFFAWLAVKFLQDGEAFFTFSRRPTSMLVVSGPWSSLLGAFVMIMSAAMFGGLIADYFDSRANERSYEKFMNWCSAVAGVFLALAIVVGYQIEHVRWVAL